MDKLYSIELGIRRRRLSSKFQLLPECQTKFLEGRRGGRPSFDVSLCMCRAVQGLASPSWAPAPAPAPPPPNHPRSPAPCTGLPARPYSPCTAHHCTTARPATNHQRRRHLANQFRGCGGPAGATEAGLRCGPRCNGARCSLGRESPSRPSALHAIPPLPCPAPAIQASLSIHT